MYRLCVQIYTTYSTNYINLDCLICTTHFAIFSLSSSLLISPANSHSYMAETFSLFFGTNGNSITMIGSVTLTYIYLFPLWTSNEKKNRKETKSIVIQKHFRKTFRNDDNGENIYLDIYIYLSDAIHGHNLVSQIFTINILYIYYLEMWRNRKASNENDAFFRRNQ